MRRTHLFALLAALLTAALLTAGARLDTGAFYIDSAAIGGNAFSTITVSPPSGLAASDSGQESTVLSWTGTGTPSATGYAIYRSLTSGGPYTQIGTVSGAGTTTFTDPQVLTTPAYYVAAALDYNFSSSQTAEAAAVAPNTAYRSAVLASSPYFWWRFDEQPGATSFADAANNAGPGTLKNGTPIYQQPSALTSSEGYSMATDAASVQIGRGMTTFFTNTFTYEMWVKPTQPITLGAESTTGLAGQSGQQYAWLPSQVNQASFPDWSDAGLSVGTNGIQVVERTLNGSYMPILASYPATLSGWQHIVVVYNAKKPTIYLNGVAVHTGLTSPRTAVAAPYSVGGNGDFGPFQGGVDEAAVYTRALTAAEIADHYNTGRRAPRSLATSSTGTALNLTWSPAAAPVVETGGYKVYRGTSPTSLTLLGTSGPGVTSYSDTTGTAGATYYYAVAAVTASGDTNVSAPVTGVR